MEAQAGLPPDHKMSDCKEGSEDVAVSPVPSCLSMKSDDSKENPPNFSNEPGPSDAKGQYSRQRAESPAPSCLSMKSDFSKESPPYFSNEPGPSDSKGQYSRQRAESPAPSCLSMKSDFSKEAPPYFSNEPGLSDSKLLSRSSCLSVGLCRSGATAVVRSALTTTRLFTTKDHFFFKAGKVPQYAVYCPAAAASLLDSGVQVMQTGWTRE